MSRRIEVELTSSRPDGVWTWRAAGARQPKGELDGALLYPDAKVGDVVRADADFDIEGIRVIAVLPPKGARAQPELLEIIGSVPRDEPGVTTQLASGKRRRSDWDDDRGARGDRGRGDHKPGGARGGGGGRDGRGGGDARGTGAPRGDARPGGRGAGPGGDRDRGRAKPGGPGRGATGDERTRADRPSGDRRPRSRPPVDTKPKVRRLKPGRTHRQALVKALPESHRPIADLLLHGGIPSVRQAVDHQNELLVADGKPPLRVETLLDIAERLMPAIRGAEWRDKAEAALSAGDDVDIRDLRSVVVAGDDAARDEASRELAAQLRANVTARVDREHQAWLVDIDESIKSARLVRALRASSRPPKAGVPFPAELSQRLAQATAEGLTKEITADRYATLLDALALSPIRLQVAATSIPAAPDDELVSAVKRLAPRIPQIALQFGIDPTVAPPKRGRPAKPIPAPTPPPPPPPPPAASEPASEPVSPEPVAVASDAAPSASATEHLE